MRNWLHHLDGTTDPTRARLVKEDGVTNDGKRVVVVHCKAGKGRSGTSLVSYLISEEGWPMEKALARFTERRMRPGFGAGVSIPSQVRYIGYVQRWADHNKFYLDQQVEVLEVHVWGLRDGCKIAVEGFIEEGKTIKTFHVFTKEERDDAGPSNTMAERVRARMQPARGSPYVKSTSQQQQSLPSASTDSFANLDIQDPTTTITPPPAPNLLTNAIFRPSSRLILPTSDINLAIERRSRAGYGWAMVTSVAHVWFNVFFEGNGPEKQSTSSNAAPARADDSGVFTIDWEDMDGIKGSSRKGVRAFDRVAVNWRTVPDGGLGTGGGVAIVHPAPGERVEDTAPANANDHDQQRDPHEAAPSAAAAAAGGMAQDLGLRLERADSLNLSKANSVYDNADAGGDEPSRTKTAEQQLKHDEDEDESFQGINRGLHLPNSETHHDTHHHHLPHTLHTTHRHDHNRTHAPSTSILDADVHNTSITGTFIDSTAPSEPAFLKDVHTVNVQGTELRDRQEHLIGDVKMAKGHDISSS